MLILTFLDPNWKVVASIWPDVRLQSFVYVLPAGEYQIKLDAPGEDETESVTWLMAGDNWICLNEDTPLPDDILFTYQEDCVYELPTEGLGWSWVIYIPLERSKRYSRKILREPDTEKLINVYRCDHSFDRHLYF